MLTAKELKQFAQTLSVECTGVCDAGQDEVLLDYLKWRRASSPVCEFEEPDLEKRTNPKLLMPESTSVFVCLFPYYKQNVPQGNISHYAMVEDYHQVAKAILGTIKKFICNREPKAQCLMACDTSPLVDRWLAYKAGLGFFGKNNLLIHPVYGSYFFIGSLLLNIPLTPDAPMQERCGRCNACINACPGGALSEDFGFDYRWCISYLTQKKSFSLAEKQIMEKQNSVYGCDVCQKVCPHNQKLPDTPIEGFYKKMILGLEQCELENMSNREFKKRYQNYAFSWCSKQTILKNFDAISKENKHGNFITGR